MGAFSTDDHTATIDGLGVFYREAGPTSQPVSERH
jgi:hypothetical protein